MKTSFEKSVLAASARFEKAQQQDDARKLADVKALLCQAVPACARYLDIAKGGWLTKSYAFAFDPAIPTDAALDEVSRVMKFKNRNSSLEVLAVCMAHELRHLNQYHVLRLSQRSEADMTPAARLFLTRVLEGDAHSFHRHAALALEKKNGAHLPQSAGAPGNDTQSWRDSFMTFQSSSLAANHYDRKTLSLCGEFAPLTLKTLLAKYDFGRILTTPDGTPYFSGNLDLAQNVINSIPATTRRAALRIG